MARLATSRLREREARERPPNQRKPETGFKKVLLFDSVPHILVEKCLERFQCVYYSVHRFLLTVNTGREKMFCPVISIFCLTRESKMIRRENGLSEGQARVRGFLRPID